jgi:hypothetical protein
LCDWLASEGWNDVFLDLDPSAASRRGSAGRGRCTKPLRSDHLPRVGELARLRLVREGILDRARVALADPTRTIASLPEEFMGVWQMSISLTARICDCFRSRKPGSNEEGISRYSQSGLMRLKRGLEKAGLDARNRIAPAVASGTAASCAKQTYAMKTENFRFGSRASVADRRVSVSVKDCELDHFGGEGRSFMPPRGYTNQGFLPSSRNDRASDAATRLEGECSETGR